MVRAFRSEADAGSIVQPKTSPFLQLLRDLQPFTSPLDYSPRTNGGLNASPPIWRTASAIVAPCPFRTSTCRSLDTISSSFFLLHAIADPPMCGIIHTSWRNTFRAYFSSQSDPDDSLHVTMLHGAPMSAWSAASASAYTVAKVSSRPITLKKLSFVRRLSVDSKGVRDGWD